MADPFRTVLIAAAAVIAAGAIAAGAAANEKGDSPKEEATELGQALTAGVSQSAETAGIGYALLNDSETAGEGVQ